MATIEEKARDFSGFKDTGEKEGESKYHTETYIDTIKNRIGGIKMEQFSLEKYLGNPERKVVTRNGLPARIICTDRKQERPIIALIKERDGTETIYTYSTQGGFWKNNEPSSNLDLMFYPTKKEGWVNIYASQIAGDRYPGYSIFPNESDARLAVENRKTYIATCKIEWEE